MIKEVKMFGCECDNCGEKWRDDHNGFVAFTRKSDMEMNVQSCDWHIHTETKNQDFLPFTYQVDRHYCPDCFMGLDEFDKPILAEIEDV